MADTSRIISVITGAIDDYNMDIPESDYLDKTPDTILFDKEGKLDSVGFVTLSTAIEARIQKEFGKPFSLFTQEAMNHPDKPLRTIQTLIAYLAEKLKA